MEKSMEVHRRDEVSFRNETEALFVKLKEHYKGDYDDRQTYEECERELDEALLMNFRKFVSLCETKHDLIKTACESGSRRCIEVVNSVDNFEDHIRTVMSEEYLRMFSRKIWRCHYDFLKKCKFVDRNTVHPSVYDWPDGNKAHIFFYGVDKHFIYHDPNTPCLNTSLFTERYRYDEELIEAFNPPDDKEIREEIEKYIRGCGIFDFSFYLDMIEYYRSKKKYFCSHYEFDHIFSINVKLERGNVAPVLISVLWKKMKKRTKNEFLSIEKRMHELVLRVLYSSIYMDRPFEEDELPPSYCTKSARNR